MCPPFLRVVEPRPAERGSRHGPVNKTSHVTHRPVAPEHTSRASKTRTRRPGGPLVNNVRVHDALVMPDPMTRTSTCEGSAVASVGIGKFAGGAVQNGTVGSFTGKPGEDCTLCLTERYSALSSRKTPTTSLIRVSRLPMSAAPGHAGPVGFALFGCVYL
jgi:hypothetical protein